MIDHCTLWPDRILNWDWSACCLAHDKAYALGVDRLIADHVLADCVANSMGGLPYLLPVVMGVVMWFGVRLFGAKFYQKSLPEAKKEMKQ